MRIIIFVGVIATTLAVILFFLTTQEVIENETNQNAIDFSYLSQNWVVNSDSIATTTQDTTAASIAKSYNFLHKEKSIEITFGNKVWALGTEDYINIVESVFRYSENSDYLDNVIIEVTDIVPPQVSFIMYTNSDGLTRETIIINYE